MTYSVLLIEDNSMIQTMIKNTLEVYGYHIDVRENGQDGIEKFKSNHYDLLIVDLLLPVVDGSKVIEAVRATSTIPIIVVSVKDETSNKVNHLRGGADDYLTKPFSVDELMARVENLLNRRRLNTHKVVINGVHIDIDQHLVIKNNEKMFLTNTEHALLQFLLEYENETVSKQEIIENIWEKQYFKKDNNTLNVTIKRLREKVEKNPAHPKIIETVWGHGYRLNK